MRLTSLTVPALLAAVSTGLLSGCEVGAPQTPVPPPSPVRVIEWSSAGEVIVPAPRSPEIWRLVAAPNTIVTVGLLPASDANRSDAYFEVLADLEGDPDSVLPAAESGAIRVPVLSDGSTIVSVTTIPSGPDPEVRVRFIEARPMSSEEIVQWTTSFELMGLRRTVRSGDDRRSTRLARLLRNRFHRRLARTDEPAFADGLRDLALALAESNANEIPVRDLLDECREIRERRLEPGDPARAEILTLLASLDWNVGRFDRAAELQERAFAITTSESSTDSDEIAVAEIELGKTYARAGRYAEALSLLSSALAHEERRSPPDPLALADLCASISELLRLQARYEESKSMAARAVAFARELVGPMGEVGGTDEVHVLGAALVALAGSDYDLHSFVQAEQTYREVDSLFSSIDTPPGYKTIAARNIAMALRGQGRLAEADRAFDRALEIARSDLPLTHPEHFWVFRDVAETRMEQGRFDEAWSLAEEAHDRLASTGDAGTPQLHHPILLMARICIERKQFLEGARLCEEAIRLQSKFPDAEAVELASARIHLARCLWASRGVSSSKQCEELILPNLSTLTRLQRGMEVQIEGLRLLARIRDAQGNAAAAESLLVGAVSKIETLRIMESVSPEGRIRRFSRFAAIYAQAADVLLRSGKPEEALFAVEQCKARVLLEDIERSKSGADGSLSQVIPEPLRAREENARARYTEARERLNQVRSRPDLKAHERKQRIERAIAEQNEALGELQGVEAEVHRLSQSLAGHEAASPSRDEDHPTTSRPFTFREPTLSYLFGEEESLLLLTLPNGSRIHGVRLRVDSEQAKILGCKSGALTGECMRVVVFGDAGREGLIEAFRRPVDLDAGTKMRLRTLHAVLFPEEIWAKIRSAPSILVIPDGPLHAFPLVGLVLPDTEEFWIQGGPVVRFAPSLRFIQELESQPRPTAPKQEILVVANPARAGLGSAEREVEALLRAFGGSKVHVLRGTDATESAVRDGLLNCSIAHFATHARATEVGGFSLAEIALSPERSSMSARDGHLDLHEIIRLKVSPSLVTLSACETHVGPMFQGEGVMALSRGFLAAGARTVVSTLFPVEDKATSALMARFYERTADPSRDRSISSALFEAQREIANEPRWAAPYFWAGVLVTGADEDIGEPDGP